MLENQSYIIYAIEHVVYLFQYIYRIKIMNSSPYRK